MSPAPNDGKAAASCPSPLKEVLRADLHGTIPSNISILHYLGGLMLVFLGLQVVTGLLLAVYYRPSPAAAHMSVVIITDEVYFGWLIRSLHRWGADLLVILCTLHMYRIYLSRAYQVPRQRNWTIGVMLLMLVFAMAFTGLLLPWDQYAYWYISSAQETISGVPVVGSIMMAIFWGGWELGGEVLLRFHALHMGLLPWLALTLVAVHVLLVWRFGIKEPRGKAAAPPRRPLSFPDLLLDLLIASLLIGGLLLSVAVIFPPPLLEQADALSPLSNIQPPWYLLPLRGLLRSLPGGGLAALAVTGAVLLLFLVPTLDRTPAQSPWKLVLQRWLAIGAAAAWVSLGIAGYLR